MHLSKEQLESGLVKLADPPAVHGTLDMIVARPAVGERLVVGEGRLVVGEGLEGDNYLVRGSPSTEDGSAHPEAQLNVMSSCVLDMIADGDKDRWKWAGDQLLVNLDLSVANLPPGTRLAVGEDAIIEVAAKPHAGCAKFADRYGIDAARFVNSRKELRLRGLNAMVVQEGTIRTGDPIKKLD